MFNRVRYWHVALLLAVLGYHVFKHCLHAPAYYDDDYVIKQNLWIHTMPKGSWYAQRFSDSGHFFMSYRPTLILSYWLNAKFPGDLIYSLRVGSLILHVLNAFLVFALASRWVSHRYRFSIALLTAVLFMIHPVQTLGIAFIWKRSSVLCCTWILLGLLHWAKYFNNDLKWKTGIFHIFIQLVCFFGAVTSKEEGIIYPLAVILSEVLFAQNRSPKFYKFFKWGGVGAVLLIIMYSVWKADFTLASLGSSSRWDHLRASVSVLPYYFLYMLIPEPRILDEPIRAVSWITPESLTFAALGFFSIWVVIRCKKSWPTWCVLIAWLAFIPTQTIHPLFLIMDQIRMYIPILGFSGFVAWIIWSLPGRVPLILSSFVLLASTVLTTVQSERYQTFEDIWMDVTEKYPKSFVAWDNLGAYYEKTSQYPKSIYAYTMAQKANPSNLDFSVRQLLGRYRNGEDKAQLKRELLALPLGSTTDAMAILHSSLLASELGLYEMAEINVTHFLQYYPGHSFGHYVLGNIFERTGRLPNAWKAYKNTLILDPNFGQARQRIKALEAQGVKGEPLAHE